MSLKEKYFNQARKLESIYPHLNFRNHCYWRIALDNTLSAKWDTVIQKPAYLHLTENQLRRVIQLLEDYEKDQELLIRHNSNSLRFRQRK